MKRFVSALIVSWLIATQALSYELVTVARERLTSRDVPRLWGDTLLVRVGDGITRIDAAAVSIAKTVAANPNERKRQDTEWSLLMDALADAQLGTTVGGDTAPALPPPGQLLVVDSPLELKAFSEDTAPVVATLTAGDFVMLLPAPGPDPQWFQVETRQRMAGWIRARRTGDVLMNWSAAESVVAEVQDRQPLNLTAAEAPEASVAEDVPPSPQTPEDQQPATPSTIPESAPEQVATLEPEAAPDAPDVWTSSSEQDPAAQTMQEGEIWQPEVQVEAPGASGSVVSQQEYREHPIRKKGYYKKKGAAKGALIGGLLGLLSGGDIKSVAVGAAAGALIGLAVGAVKDHKLRDKDTTARAYNWTPASGPLFRIENVDAPVTVSRGGSLPMTITYVSLVSDRGSVAVGGIVGIYDGAHNVVPEAALGVGSQEPGTWQKDFEVKLPADIKPGEYDLVTRMGFDKSDTDDVNIRRIRIV